MKSGRLGAEEMCWHYYNALPRIYLYCKLYWVHRSRGGNDECQEFHQRLVVFLHFPAFLVMHILSADSHQFHNIIFAMSEQHARQSRRHFIVRTFIPDVAEQTWPAVTQNTWRESKFIDSPNYCHSRESVFFDTEYIFGYNRYEICMNALNSSNPRLTDDCSRPLSAHIHHPEDNGKPDSSRADIPTRRKQ